MGASPPTQQLTAQFDDFSADNGYLRSRLEAQLQAADAVLQLQEDIPDSVPVEDLKKWWLFAVAVEDLRTHVHRARGELGTQSRFACSCSSGDAAVLESVGYLERWQDRWTPMTQALQASVEELGGDEKDGSPSGDKDEAAQAMRRLSIPEILDLMKASTSNAQVLGNALLNMGLMARNKDERDQIAANGGIELTLDAIRTFPKLPKLQRHGCMCLVNLSLDSKVANKLVSLGAIKALVDAMINFQKSQRVHEHCVQALANISYRGNESKVVALGGIEVLFSSMRTHKASWKLQRYGCAALGNLASSSKVAKDILARGGAEMVVSSMKIHRKECKVQSKGCFAVTVLCVNSEARKQFDKQHAVESVLEAMEEHCEDAKVQEHGCSALIALSQSSSIKGKIIAKGGFRLVNDALKNHIRVKEMQQLGPLALKALAV